MQKQQVKFECPMCGTPLDIATLEKEGQIHVAVEFENGSPSLMVAGVVCPGCQKLVNPKTVL